MSAFFGLIVRIVFGGFPFSFWAWLAMSGLLLVTGAVLCTVAPALVEPVAVEIAVRPARVGRWLGLSLVMWVALIMLLVITIVGSPLAVLAAFAALLVGGVGYIACGLITGDRLARGFGRELPGWQAVLVGISLFRLLRLLPIVGGVLHALVIWAGFAAASCLVWDAVRSWHARRLPDKLQFPDEKIIEWHPPDAE